MTTAAAHSAEPPWATDPNQAELRTSRWVLHPVTLFVLILAILAFRSRNALLWPELGWEDGNQMLAFFFNTRNPSSVFRFYNGYAFLVPNMVAWLATRGPVIWAPYLFTLASLAMAACGMWLVSRPQLSWLIPNAVDRSVVAVLLALIPLGRGFLIFNLSYSLWSLLFLLFVLLAQPLAGRTVPLLVQSGAVILCILSHPLSLLALPACVVHWAVAKRPAHRMCAALFILAIGLYQWFGVEHNAPFRITLAGVQLAGKLFLSRVVFETVFGTMATTTLMEGNAQLLHYFALTLLAALAFSYLRKRAAPSVCGAVLLAILVAFGVVFVSVAVRLAGIDDPHYFMKPYLQRYLYVSKLLLATLFFSELVSRIRPAFSSSGVLARTVLVAGCATYLSAVIRANASLYHGSAAEGKRVRSFLETVQQNLNLAKQGGQYSSDWRLEREPGWGISLSIDAHLGRSSAWNGSRRNE